MVKIILHCSASSFGNAALIAKWHVQERGWSGIGYHYVILNGWLTSNLYNPFFNGHIETGRPLDDDPVVKNSEQGAHVRGHNYNSVGICLIGNSGNFTDEQLNSSLELVQRMERQFNTIQICQHSDLDSQKPNCAGIDMEKWKRNYALYKEIATTIPEDGFIL
ncbi:MAG: N-acetylmuramoyl-L-alanine amidase [Bacteroidales bacterium]